MGEGFQRHRARDNLEPERQGTRSYDAGLLKTFLDPAETESAGDQPPEREDMDKMKVDDSASIPLWLLYEDELEAWRAQQPPFLRQWLTEQNFKAERHRVALVPGATGALAAAVGGLGKRHGDLSLWHAAGIAERLPPRRFHLAQEVAAAQSTQLSLGFAYAGYRFERYRQAKNDTASLDTPPNADAPFVLRAAEALSMARDWINTPAADFGPAELAAAAHQLALRHGAEYKEWVGEELLTANFPAIHAVGRASDSCAAV